MKRNLNKVTLLTAVIITMLAVTAGVVVIQLTKKIAIDVDGEMVITSVRGETVKDALASANVTVAKDTLVEPALSSKLKEDLKVKVRYPRAVTTVVDGVQEVTTVHAATVKEALESLSIDVEKDAYTSAKPTTKLPKDEVEKPIVVSNVKPVTLKVAGEVKVVETNAPTVAAVLKEENIEVNPEDELSTAEETYTEHGLEIELVAIRTEEKDEEEVTPFKTVVKEDPNLAYGQEKVEAEGVNRVVIHSLKLTYADEQLRDREVLSTKVVTEGSDKVIIKGTSMPAVDPGSSKAIAQRLLAEYGWGADQFVCLEKLWQKESGWNYKAENKSSGAYGIPQSLPGSKMASAGADWRTNPETQIKWGLGYIKGRYGSPCGAYQASQAKGWY